MEDELLGMSRTGASNPNWYLGRRSTFFPTIWTAVPQKPKEKWSKYRFFIEFWIQFGPHKNISGPQVGRPWSRTIRIIQDISPENDTNFLFLMFPRLRSLCLTCFVELRSWEFFGGSIDSIEVIYLVQKMSRFTPFYGTRCFDMSLLFL
jgi:hypothetical protein